MAEPFKGAQTTPTTTTTTTTTTTLASQVRAAPALDTRGRASSCSPAARTEQKPGELWERSQGSDSLWERRLDPCEPGSREILLRWHFSFQERKLAGLLA